MKKITLLVLILIGKSTTAQNNLSPSGNIGIGILNPTKAIQIGEYGSGTDNSQLLIPGIYNFEQVRLGQVGNGNNFLEFVNHIHAINSYGVRLTTNVDNGGPGLQFQIATPQSSYEALDYQTGMFMSINKQLGIGTISPIGKLDVRGSTFIGNNDLAIGAVGSFVQIDQGATTGNTYSQIRAFSNGGNLTNNLILQNSGGNVGIGTADPKGYKLAVAGNMIAESVKVQFQGSWSDFVFAKDYKLPTLRETEKHIKEKGCLPGIPSAVEVKANGIDLGDMNGKLLQKIEELTLYIIDQQKNIKEL
jgi:hypothetical protein